MIATHVHIIRHGETTWNSEKRWQGQLDSPLSERGRQQARLLANYLQSQPITTIYASDLQRARVTAEIISTTVSAPVRLDARLREMNLGVLQGLTIDEIHQQYPSELEGLRQNWLEYRVTNGENRLAVQMRAYQVFEEVAERANGPEVALVTHGGVIRVLLHRLLRGSSEAMTFPIENTSLTTVVRDESMWRLERLAETPHLAPHMPPSGEIEAQ